MLISKIKIMRLTIQFNWPTGEDSAIVHLADPNIEDKKAEFRIGVIPKGEKNKIAWHNLGWINGEKVLEEKIEFKTRRGDEVVVEKRNKGQETASWRSRWDVEEKWPAEAVGPSTTFVPWIF